MQKRPDDPTPRATPANSMSLDWDAQPSAETPDGDAVEADVEPETEAERLARVLHEAEELDAQAQRDWSSQVSADEACIEALKNSKQPTRMIRRRKKTRGLRNPKIRMRFMLSTAAVLFMACAAVYGPNFFREDAGLRVPKEELSGGLVLVDAMAIGSMLHASVSRWAWDDLEIATRIQGVTELGAKATARGLQSVYLTDTEDQQLAVWTRNDGVSLATLD